MADKTRELNPLEIHKALCVACHKFYDSTTGERVKELEHITVANVDEREHCKPCIAERRVWNHER